MPHLALSLLGPFEASLDGQPITSFRSNKVRALLAYLAVESDRLHPRDSLAGLLWPGYVDRSALNSLRSSLANLRQAIGDRVAQPPFLFVTRDVVQFNVHSDYSLDVAALMEALPSGRATQDLVDQLQRAADLYGGDFLEGFSIPDSAPFEEWASLRREHYRQHALGILHRLAEECEAAGDYVRAESYARQCLELDAWDEEAHRQLMRTLTLGGRRSAALSQYEACRRLLGEGLGVEPAPETAALYEQIRDGTLQKAEIHRISLATPVAPTLDRLPEPAMVQRPLFVGRQTELGQLDRFLDTVLARHGRVIFLVGEPGSGKTALAQEFGLSSMERHASLVVATGECNAMIGVGDPYTPFIEILQMLVGDIEAEWLGGSITQDHARRLWSLVPNAVDALLRSGQDLIGRFVPGEVLLSRLQACVPREDAALSHLREVVERTGVRARDVQQAHLFEQYTHTLQALARKGPLILVLDNLQWADTGSIGLLFHLGRRLEGYPILVVGIYRHTDVALGRDGERHPLVPVVSELERVFGSIHVNLDQADGWDFLESLLDSEPNRLDAIFRQNLYEYAGGQPLFTVELLRGLQERGDLLQDEEGRWIDGPRLNWDQLPARVEAVIGERIGRLPSELRETLSVASVEGETFAGQVIARVQNADERTVIGQLSGPLSKEHRLVVAQSVSTVGGQPLYRYRFHHQLVQMYLYDRLDAVERAYLHGQVGDALKEVYSDQPEAMVAITPQLGWHYREAGRMIEASENLHSAGREAVRLSAPQEALRYFGQALALAKANERDRILSDRSRLLLALFRGHEAAEDCELLLDRARDAGDRSEELDALLGLARANYVMALDAEESDFASRSRELYEAAYNLASELADKAGMARALIPTHWFDNFWPDYRDQADANVREALALSQEVGDEELIIASEMAMLRFVSLPESEALAEELVRGLERRHELLRLKEVYFRLMWTHLWRGSFARCVECCDAGIRLAAELGAPPVMYPTIKALALLNLGAYGVAWASLQEEVTDEEHRFGRVFRAYGMGVYFLELTAYESAAEMFDRVLEPSRGMGRSWLRRGAQIGLARSLVRAGQLDEARLEGIVEDLASMGETLPADTLAEIALSCGKLDEAVQEAKRAAADAEGEGRRPTQASALELVARALLRLDRPEDAVSLAEEGIALAEEMSVSPMMWRLRAGKARALQMLGQRDAARQEYEAAAATIRVLADSIPDAQLREGFLADPSVAAVLGGPR